MQYSINLGKNGISETGCRWLSKANWKKLNFIWLGMNILIQNVTKFVGKAKNISVLVTGP
jgi:hypothetical protein